MIFTFHMPLFLVLSGYVFTDKGSFGRLAVKKARTLLIPFAGYFLLGLAVTLLLPQWRQGLTLAGIKQDLWLADPNAVHNSSIWYLVCLFFVVLLFKLIHKLPVYAQLLCLLVFYALGMHYSVNRFPVMGYSRLPLNLDVLPVAIVFYALGYYAKVSGTMQSLSKKWIYELLGAVVGTVGVFVVYKYNGYVNLHGLNFGAGELYLLGGLFGTLAVVGASALVSRWSVGIFKWCKAVLIWYGRHSLMILGLQSLLIRLYIVAMGHFFGIRLDLYQFPRKHTVICTVLVAFVVCPLLCLLWDGMKTRLKEMRK